MHREKKKYRNLAIGMGILDVLLITVLAVLVFQLLTRDKNSGDIEADYAVEKTAELASKENIWPEGMKGKETGEATGEAAPSEAVIPVLPEAETAEPVPPETEALDSMPLETQPAGVQPLEYVGAMSPAELKTAADFVAAASPDGAYSFMYPTDYFYTGNYDEGQRRYFLATAGESVTVEIYEMPAPVQGNPYESANAMYGVLKSDFLEGEACPYLHQSSGVADDGYSRLIIGGPLAGDASRAAYYCIAFNNTTAYVLKAGYTPVNQSGIGLDYTQTGYLMDCMYRGWSLSGSTYMLRSYEQYLVDDMGDKKPGES